MNSRTHLSLVPAAPAGSTPRRHAARRAVRPAGGRAASATALAAGLTLGLTIGALATLSTHPGDVASLLLPIAGAAGITIAAAFRSRAVARRRRRVAVARRERDDLRRRTLRPKPVLVHSSDEVRPVLVAERSVAQPTRRAA